MEYSDSSATVHISQLPPQNTSYLGGVFKGILTYPDGVLRALIVLRNGKEFTSKCSWTQGATQAAKAGGRLPSRIEASYIRALDPSYYARCWHWTSETDGDYKAHGINFFDGIHDLEIKTVPGKILVVRTLDVVPKLKKGNQDDY